jgi:mannose-6-phosphate isomerase-like protein (cupin superfamily)
LLCDDPSDFGGATELVAPNGTRVTIAPARPPIVMPPAQTSLVVTRRTHDARSGEGRAGMHYRDLVPGRQGGRLIASHITIDGAGPVPDYVHYHRIRFQMIYCKAGWVRVVYEDQGPPFVLRAGDCVLQPPEIRHRVLESSAGLEVIEVTAPAEHETFADHDLALPTRELRPDRSFEGQRFVRHEAALATRTASRIEGFDACGTGIAAATGNLASVRVLRRTGRGDPAMRAHDAELLFWYVLRGAMTLRLDGKGDERLGVDDAVVIPPRMLHAPMECSNDLEVLEVEMA